MTRKIKFANNATSNLAAGITNSATSISLTPGTGAKFPSLSAGQFFMGTLVKSDGSTEVVKVTARATDTLTVVRAAESVGGASTAYAFSAGDKFEARLTAGGLGNELDRLDGAAIISPLNKSADYTVTEADQTSLVRVDSSSGAKTITLPQISTLTDDFDVLVAKVSSDTNNVAVARSGADTINGATSYNLTTQWQSVWLVADRSTNTWTAVSTSLAANLTDAAIPDKVTAATTKPTPVDADTFGFVDSVGGLLAKFTWANLKAALFSSPSFTGAPTATTPPQFDNDTSLATTAFVQRALGNRSASVSYAAATTNLPASDAGKAICLSGSASVVNLPALSAVGDGATFAIQCAVPVTINRNGADIIAANGGGQTSLSLTANSTVVLTKSSAVNAWVVDGTARLLYDGNFTSYLASSGYQKLPSGLIIQWGNASVPYTYTYSSSNVTFPVAFPNACAAAFATPRGYTGSGVAVASITAQSTTGFTIYGDASSGETGTFNTFWLAIGY